MEPNWSCWGGLEISSLAEFHTHLDWIWKVSSHGTAKLDNRQMWRAPCWPRQPHAQTGHLSSGRTPATNHSRLPRDTKCSNYKCRWLGPCAGFRLLPGIVNMAAPVLWIEIFWKTRPLANAQRQRKGSQPRETGRQSRAWRSFVRRFDGGSPNMFSSFDVRHGRHPAHDCVQTTHRQVIVKAPTSTIWSAIWMPRSNRQYYVYFQAAMSATCLQGYNKDTWFTDVCRKFGVQQLPIRPGESLWFILWRKVFPGWHTAS